MNGKWIGFYDNLQFIEQYLWIVVEDHIRRQLSLADLFHNMLDRITVKYGHLNGKQLEELSHAEAPYIGTELKKEIPYELAFYRGTDFNDL